MNTVEPVRPSKKKNKLPVLDSTRRQLQNLRDLPLLARSFSLLGDPTRMKILMGLTIAGELCVTDIADILEMETSAISHQLRKLKDGGLVLNNRDGATIYYRIDHARLKEQLNTFRNLVLD